LLLMLSGSGGRAGVGRRAVAWPPRVLRRALCEPYAVQACPSDRDNQQPEELFYIFILRNNSNSEE
jgi:hypothetical protein